MTSHIISAPPSQGKSYIGTKIAVEALKSGKEVFSNYPIIYTFPLPIHHRVINLFCKLTKEPQKYIPKKLQTNIWIDTYFDMGLHDCIVILDEAYKVVNCHNKMTDSQHDFFATTGHNNVDIYVIAQNYARLHTIIREMSMFIIVSKFANPLSLISKTGRKELTPLFFILEWYLSEGDYAMKRVRKNAIYKTERVLFNKDIANAYKTQYYKRKAKPIAILKWDDSNTCYEEDKEKNFKLMLEKEKEEKMKNEFILQE